MFIYVQYCRTGSSPNRFWIVIWISLGVIRESFNVHNKFCILGTTITKRCRGTWKKHTFLDPPRETTQVRSQTRGDIFVQILAKGLLWCLVTSHKNYLFNAFLYFEIRVIQSHPDPLFLQIFQKMAKTKNSQNFSKFRKKLMRRLLLKQFFMILVRCLKKIHAHC